MALLCSSQLESPRFATRGVSLTRRYVLRRLGTDVDRVLQHARRDSRRRPLTRRYGSWPRLQIDSKRRPSATILRMIRTGRLALWLMPASFCAFALFLVLGSPDVGGRISYAVLAAVCGYGVFRARRVAVGVFDDELVVYGLVRTHRLALHMIGRAIAAPMRTASPFRGDFPYVALTVELVDGRTKQFEEVSRSESDRALVDEVVALINSRL